MQFVHSEEQQLIRESARGFLAARADAAQLRAAMSQPGGYDQELWREMAGELGWAGLAIASDCGGAGLGWVELCILQEEQGRRLVASPFFASVALAGAIVRGERCAAPRAPQAHCRWQRGSPARSAAPTAGRRQRPWRCNCAALARRTP